MSEPGNLFVIAAPSGAGKTSLVKAATESLEQIMVSISHTTRPMRPGETDGVNYFFISKDKFDEMVAHEDFLEHATIFDNYYGTSKSTVKKTLEQGIDVILEIDWQGHQQIKHLFPESVGIFILPPSLKDLQSRLVNRNQDKPEVITQRLLDAKSTITHITEFDYIIINDNFDQALIDLLTIFKVCRLRAARQLHKYATIIKDLRQA